MPYTGLNYKAISSLNEGMVKILSDVAENGGKVNAGSIMAALFDRKNAASVYISQFINPKLLVIDFKQLSNQSNQSVNVSVEINAFLIAMQYRTQDRFINELQFLYQMLKDKNEIGVSVENILSRYCNIEHCIEDLEDMLPPTPNKIWSQNAETMLDVFGKNLTEAAHNGELDPVLNRDTEIHRMIQILIRKTKSNPILIGKPGTGKTAIVEGLASILNEAVGIPVSLSNTKLYQLNIASILAAGASGPGALEKILEQLVQVAKKEDAILFIDEVHVIMNDGAKIANALKPAMARGDIRLIGATTEDEYKRAFDGDEAMQRRFQPVRIEEQDKTSIYRILQQKARQMEEYHNVLVPNESLLKAITLSEKFIPDRQQPDKSIDLVEEASSKLRMTLESKPERMVELQSKIGEAKISFEMLHVKAEGGYELSERDVAKMKKYKKLAKKLMKEYKKLDVEFQDQRAIIDELLYLKDSKINADIELEILMHAGSFKEALEIREVEIPGLLSKILVAEERLMQQNLDQSLVQNVVQPDMISKVIEIWTGIPASAQSQEDLDKYKNIEHTLMKSVHGQEEPIREIAAAIKRSKAGLAGSEKPLGSFLCLGPTGVGKTYLAQQLAKFMFDTDKVLVRYDMSEYMEPHSVSKLFGSPPGYVGYAEGGQLTEQIRRNPYSIILFDEIEKAHPKVFDTLLQVLDAGRMTDGQGHTVNFKNTVIIMTSNIGSDLIRAGIEQELEREVIEYALMEEVGRNFRPEFLNRFDAKVMFNSLDIEAVVKIAESELKIFAETLSNQNEIDLYWSKLVPSGIAIVANDPMNGARPIKRFINDTIVNQLTDMILQQEIRAGSRAFLDIFAEEFIVTSVTKAELKEIKEVDAEKLIPDIDLIDIGDIPEQTNILKVPGVIDADVIEEETDVTDVTDTDIIEFPDTETGDL